MPKDDNKLFITYDLGGWSKGMRRDIVGRALLIRGFGTMANQATAATLAPVLSLDAAAGTLLAAGTIFTLPAITPTASTVVPFEFEIYVTANVVGATGGTTLQCNGNWQHSVAATSTIPVATNLSSYISTSLTTLSAGAQLFPELWCTCSASGTHRRRTNDSRRPLPDGLTPKCFELSRSCM